MKCYLECITAEYGGLSVASEDYSNCQCWCKRPSVNTQCNVNQQRADEYRWGDVWPPLAAGAEMSTSQLSSAVTKVRVSDSRSVWVVQRSRVILTPHINRCIQGHRLHTRNLRHFHAVLNFYTCAVHFSDSVSYFTNEDFLHTTHYEELIKYAAL